MTTFEMKAAGNWVMKITADRRIEVNEDVDVSETAHLVLKAMQRMLDETPAQEPDWKDQYEKQKLRAEMWIAKYEKDIGPLEKAVPIAQPAQVPLAWISPEGHIHFEPYLGSIPLCAQPPHQRPYVGLTDDEEIADFLGEEFHTMTESEERFFRLGMQASKEKNGV